MAYIRPSKKSEMMPAEETTPLTSSTESFSSHAGSDTGGRKAAQYDLRRASIAYKKIGSSASSYFEAPTFQVHSSEGTDRTMKVCYALYGLISYWVLASLCHKMTVNFLLAVGVVAVFAPWTIIWLVILTKSPSIYYIKVPTGRVEGWLPVSLPVAYQVQKQKPATSISNLSGIRGTILNSSLRSMTGLMAICIIIAIHQDLDFRGARFLDISSNADMVPVCLMIELSGLFLTGYFELNKFDKIHTLVHFIGVSCILFGSFSIGFLTNWETVPKILLILQFALGFMYQYLDSTTRKTCDDISYVSSQSRKCIGTELAMFIITTLILALSINGSGVNQGNIWAPPGGINHDV